MLHHDLIKSLIVEIKSLRDQVSDLEAQIDDADSYTRSANDRANRLEHQAQAAREAQRDAELQSDYNRWERQAALDKLQRAERYGNDYDKKRALDTLKRLS